MPRKQNAATPCQGIQKVSELLENADAQLTEAFEDVKSRVRNVIIEKGGERYLSDNNH